MTHIKSTSGFNSVVNNKPRKLTMQIATPSGKIIGNLPEANQTAHQTTNLGKLNELSFTVPYLVDRHNEQVRNPNIDKLKERFLIKTRVGKVVEWYIINEIKDVMGQNGDSKEIHAFSLGYELRDKMLRSYKVDPKNLREVLSEVLSSTIWSLGDIDSEFEIKYRPFDVAEQSILDFIYEVCEVFNAVVIFDTVNRQLHFKQPESVGQNVNPLRLSYKNYLKTINKTSVPDDLVTRLLVFGKEGMSIQKINPTGSNYIESFEYFLYPFQRDENRNVIRHSDYMEDELCHAILDYQELIENKQGQFKTLLEQMESKQAQLIISQNDLTNLEIELAIIEDRLEIAKSQSVDTTSIESEKASKQSEIDSQQSTVDGYNDELSVINSQIQQLQDEVALENVFSSELLKERNKYIIESTWQNEHISDEQELYEEAVKQFENLKKPKLLMEIDIVNFLEVLEEKRNWDKLTIGDDIYVHYEPFNLDVLAKIIAIENDYSNQSIKLTVANVREIESDEDKFIKQLYSSISTSKKVDMSELKWNNTSDKLGEINDIIENTWDATRRQILAGVNNSVEISKRGILVKDSEKPSEYLVMQNGVIAMTDDGGHTWKTAISPRYIVAERLAGKVIAGVNLTIENDSGLYKFDSNGFTIKNGSIKIEGGLPKNQLDPAFIEEIDTNINETNQSIENLEKDINDVLSDLKLTQLESQTIELSLAQVMSESEDIINNATTLQITTEKDDYSISIDELDTYLSSNFIGDNHSYPIDISKEQREEIKLKFEDVQKYKSILINEITKKREENAINASVGKGELINGVKIDASEGLTITRTDNRVKAIFNSTDGLKFQIKEGTQWKDKFYYDVNTSNLVIEGEINARALKVNGKNVLTTDDKIDGSFISSITTNQLTAGSAKISTAMIENLVVGSNVTMGANATINWQQVYNPPTVEQLGGLSAYSPRLTHIDAYGLYTGTVQADKIIGNTFVVDRGASGSLEMYANGNDDRIRSFGANGFRIESNGSLSLKAGSSYKIATTGAPLVVEGGMRVDYGSTQFYSTSNQGTVTINGTLNVTSLNVTGSGSGLVAVFG